MSLVAKKAAEVADRLVLFAEPEERDRVRDNFTRILADEFASLESFLESEAAREQRGELRRAGVRWEAAFYRLKGLCDKAGVPTGEAFDPPESVPTDIFLRPAEEQARILLQEFRSTRGLTVGRFELLARAVEQMLSERKRT